MSGTTGPHLHNSNLLVCLDSRDVDSYPGVGTTWFDLMNIKNGVLNGAIYDSQEKAIFFDGINDTVSIGVGSNFFPLPQLTMECFFKSAGLAGGMTKGGLMCLTYGLMISINTTGGYLSCYTHDGSSYNSTSYNLKNLFDNKWHQVGMTLDGTYRNLYIDGNKVFRDSVNWTGSTNWPSNVFNLGRDNNDAYFYLSGYISQARLYGRNLSDEEIKYNFDSMKGRFRL